VRRPITPPWQSSASLPSRSRAAGRSSSHKRRADQQRGASSCTAGLLTDVVQSQPPAARVHGRPERQQNDLICMAADLPEPVHAAAQADTCALGARQCGSLSVIDFRLRVRTDRCSCVLSRVRWHFGGLVFWGSGGAVRAGLLGVDKTGRGRSWWRASSYEVTSSRSGWCPGTAGESISGQHGCGSRLVGQAAPGSGWVSRPAGGGGGRPRGRRNA
jgi:hypothetical protein